MMIFELDLDREEVERAKSHIDRFESSNFSNYLYTLSVTVRKLRSTLYVVQLIERSKEELGSYEEYNKIFNQTNCRKVFMDILNPENKKRLLVEAAENETLSDIFLM